MDDTIDVTIPMDAEAAKYLVDRGRREALGRYLSDMLVEGRIDEILAAAIAEAKREARHAGLTDDEVDAELAAWRAERRG